MPGKGETFDIIEFVNAGVIKKWKDISFEGKGLYTGKEISMYAPLFYGYNVEIQNIHWCPKCIEIELISTEYDGDLWKEIDEYPRHKAKDFKQPKEDITNKVS